MRPLLKTSIHLIDIMSALLWVGTIALLVVATVTMGSNDRTRGLLIVWSVTVGKMALACTILSSASWIVRQFEEAFNISANVQEINNELAEMRHRRSSGGSHNSVGGRG